MSQRRKKKNEHEGRVLGDERMSAASHANASAASADPVAMTGIENDFEKMSDHEWKTLSGSDESGENTRVETKKRTKKLPESHAI